MDGERVDPISPRGSDAVESLLIVCPPHDHIKAIYMYWYDTSTAVLYMVPGISYRRVHTSVYSICAHTLYGSVYAHILLYGLWHGNGSGGI